MSIQRVMLGTVFSLRRGRKKAVQRLHAETESLRAQLIEALNGVEVARSFSRLMGDHPLPSVRAFGASLARALDDPAPWRAAIASGLEPTELARLTFSDIALAPEQPEPDGTHISSVVSAFVALWSDDLGGNSVRLVGPFAARIAESVDDVALEAARRWMCTDWVVRIHTGFWLRVIGFEELDRDLCALGPLEDSDALRDVFAPQLALARHLLTKERDALVQSGTGAGSLVAATFETALAASRAAGATAASEAGAEFCELAAGVTDLARWIWVFRTVSDPPAMAERVSELERGVEDLQLATAELLGRMLDLVPAGGEPLR